MPKQHEMPQAKLTMEQVQAMSSLARLALIITPVLVVAGFCIWLAYTGSVGLLRVWALAATAALPIALAVGWYTRGLLAAERNAGRDEATNQVLRAANNVADLRTTAVGAVRQTTYASAPAMPPQSLVMPEQLFLAPVRGREEGEIIDV
jgi:hypothetical protein